MKLLGEFQVGISERKDLTALTRAANAFDADCLAVQNAARLQCLSTQPGTEAARVRFQLETFPPRDRSQPVGETQTDPTNPPTPPPNP